LTHSRLGSIAARARSHRHPSLNEHVARPGAVRTLRELRAATRGRLFRFGNRPSSDLRTNRNKKPLSTGQPQGDQCEGTSDPGDSIVSLRSDTRDVHEGKRTLTATSRFINEPFLVWCSSTSDIDDPSGFRTN